jgi:hypothetical protein
VKTHRNAVLSCAPEIENDAPHIVENKRKCDEEKKLVENGLVLNSETIKSRKGVDFVRRLI